MRKGSKIALVGGCSLILSNYVNAVYTFKANNASGVRNIHQISLVSSLFGRPVSRVFGKCMECPISPKFRSFLYPLFAKALQIDLSECSEPLLSYPSLGAIFARDLKANTRFIAERDNPKILVSPCDGIVSTLQKVNSENIEQFQASIGPIKGATFDICRFIGMDPLELKEKNIYCAIIYLSPRHYHHFHAPAAMQVFQRKHFHGFVLPVFKSFARRFNDLFTLNERVILMGRWPFGDIALAAVAAYNVANITLEHEPAFQSNVPTSALSTQTNQMSVKRLVGGDKYAKGERVGGFRLGSSIVLLFEAPESFRWRVSQGSELKMGEVLGLV